MLPGQIECNANATSGVNWMLLADRPIQSVKAGFSYVKWYHTVSAANVNYTVQCGMLTFRADVNLSVFHASPVIAWPLPIPLYNFSLLKPS
jgi:hypothetical protein